MNDDELHAEILASIQESWNSADDKATVERIVVAFVRFMAHRDVRDSVVQKLQNHGVNSGAFALADEILQVIASRVSHDPQT